MGRLHNIQGTIELPGDKSISHRYAILGALAQGKTTLQNFSSSRDCRSTLHCLENLGVSITHQGNFLFVDGVGLRGFRPSIQPLDAENSGSTLRILSGVLAGLEFATTISGDDSLRKRPMRRIIDPLTRMGAEIEAREGNYPPLKIKGTRLKPIDYEVPIASAQVKSCVLLAGLYADGVTILRESSKTRNHTEVALKHCGADLRVENNTIRVHGNPTLRPFEAAIPGDISSACFFVVAALLVPGSALRIVNVGLNDTRLGLIKLLQSLGASIEITKTSEALGEASGELYVKYSRDLFDTPKAVLRGQVIPEIIDEIPILAMLGTQLKRGMSIRDAKELRVKESDRIKALVENLRRVGAEVEEFEDGLHINGAQRLRGGVVSSYDDHRIAMAFAIANLVSQDPIRVSDEACVAVSFPEFFETLGRIHSES